ncbi:MAG: hypothetical protein FWB99_07265 [Treponema sp.]|nr:hypothetical protein [Treponema sp.]
MKKVVVLLIFAIILASCTLDDTTIINKSRETVTVTFRHAGQHVLAPDAPPISVSTVAGMTITYTPEKWVGVNHNQSRSLIVFYDRESFPLTVRNYSEKPARLTVGALMRRENGDNNSSGRQELLHVNIGVLASYPYKKIADAGFIYSRTPQFTAISQDEGFIMSVKYFFAFDGETYRFEVIINPPPPPGGTNP